MSENRKEDVNAQAVPFFARFLEGQNCEDLTDEELERVSGGQIPEGELVVTQKYPSDGEEDSSPVTLKYPSDGEDGSSFVPSEILSRLQRKFFNIT